MFNSPMEYCVHCRQYIALDESRQACAAQHHCAVADCPLKKYFTNGTTKCGHHDAADIETTTKRS